MADEKARGPGGGGAATSAGMLFEQQLGAMLGASLIGQHPIDRRFDLGRSTIAWLRFETEAPVDDILIATEDGGFVAVQAKTNLSLSKDPASPFGKTISQFVRHWLACRDGDGRQLWNRPLDPSSDRLVLAMGPQAPESLRVHLPAALRLSTQAGGASLTQDQQHAFDVYVAAVENAWSSTTSAPLDEAFPLELAKLIRVVSFDPSGADRDAILANLRDAIEPGADPVHAANALLSVTGLMMAGRQGADGPTLRQSLEAQGLLLQAPADYRRDVEALRVHSEVVAKSLERYEVIEATAGEPITIDRECQAQLLDATNDGSFLIIGEPGAGKSGVLNALARDLRQRGADVLQLAVDRYSVETLEGLGRDLGLDHPLAEVLKAWDGPEAGWVIIDALDATRGGKGEGVFRALIEQILEADGRWKVVASIRTFDLRMGQQFKSLFEGEPPVSGLREKEFARVRHVVVPRWSPKEFDQLLTKAPKLAAALANAPQALLDLAAIPFNTRLLSDLIKKGLVKDDLSHISSQAELLQLYWDHRVAQHGARGRACLTRITETMVEARALRAATDTIAQRDPAILDELEAEGVIIKVENDRWVQFRHHLLFDFVAARVLLDPGALIAGTLRFPKDDGKGLMLAPALGFLLREIWDGDDSRANFWKAAGALLADNDSDPVIRGATGRLCAEFPSAPHDAHVLAVRIIENDATAAKAFRHVSGALAVRLEDQADLPLEPWVQLLFEVASNVEPVQGSFRFLIYRLTSITTDPMLRSGLGHAARALLRHVLSPDEQLYPASATIELVGRTFDTNPGESRALLERVFEPDRMLAFASEDVSALARKIELIAPYDPQFAMEIYERTFAHTVANDRVTHMGDSQILALRSNAVQDFDMARYSLSEYLRQFIDIDPILATDAVIAATEGFVARAHPLRDGLTDETFTVGSWRVRLRDDWSHIWAHDPDEVWGHDADALVQTLTNVLKSAEVDLALRIAQRLVGRGSLAFLWSRLFFAAAARGDELTAYVLPFAMSPPLVTSPDTRKDAIDVVASAYPGLPQSQRQAFETDAMAFDFSAYKHPALAREGFLARLFSTLGVEHLATDAAVEIVLAEANNEEAENERLFRIRSSGGPAEPYHWIGSLDREAPADKALMEAIEDAKVVLAIDQPNDADGTPATFPASTAIVLDVLCALAGAINRKTQNADLIIYAEGIIGQGVGKLIDRKMAPTEDDVAQTGRLRGLLGLILNSSGPEVGETTEADFERGASWGSPAPRVEAAEAYLDLVLQRGDLYPQLEQPIDALLADRHPAVRMQAVLRLVRLWERDRDGFWRKLFDRCEKETNLSIFEHLIANVLGRIVHHDPDRTIALSLALFARFADDTDERQARIRKSLAPLISIQWVGYGRADARHMLDAWIADIARYEAALSVVISTHRESFVVGLRGDMEEGGTDQRQRWVALAARIVDKAAESLLPYLEEPQLTQEQADAAKPFASLIDRTCGEIYFASGAFRDSQNLGRPKARPPIEDAGLKILFEENAPMLKRIGECGTPHTVYYLLQLLEYLLPIAPVEVFDLTANALKGGGRKTGYQFESMGADLFVRIVGVFLADYKEVFEDDGRRAQLIECLEIFMDAGWPSARRLLYRLPELIQ